jgi:hypothetical protein
MLVPGPKDGREVRKPGVREEVYKRSRAAVVKAKQRIQLQKTGQPASLYIPSVAIYDF